MLQKLQHLEHQAGCGQDKMGDLELLRTCHSYLLSGTAAPFGRRSSKHGLPTFQASLHPGKASESREQVLAVVDHLQPLWAAPKLLVPEAEGLGSEVQSTSGAVAMSRARKKAAS